jgi:ATP-binding cassette, subfamily B, bacterial PglK
MVLAVIMLSVAVIQMCTVFSIMPFMAVAANPDIIETNSRLAWIYQWSGLERTGFLIFLGSLVLLFVILNNVASAIGLWMTYRFIGRVDARLSRDLLRKYLNRPYLWFVQQGSPKAGKNILVEVKHFTGNTLKPMVDLFAKGVIALGLLFVIVAVNWKVALVTAVFFGGTYGMLYMALRAKLREIGEKRVVANSQRFKIVNEAFGAFKETKVLQCESYFSKAYIKPMRRMTRYMILSHLIGGLPRHALEILAFGGLVSLVLYFLFTMGDVGRFMPILILYAFAGYKLMPALQGCFSAITSLRFNHHVLTVLHKDYNSDGPVATIPSERTTTTSGKLPFFREIRLEEVTFAYPGVERPVISNLSLSIRCQTMVAFCGQTGSGKTTIADLLLGLLTPRSGRILVDGIPLTNETLRQWRRNVGYVPQHIFLADDTITRNIAFGLPDKEIDMDAVRRAAREAQLADFIHEELPQQYETVVGERGIRLSGGQRQRLGIARALYRDPDVLIFDEATSALDSATEEQVMEAVRSAAKVKTVILIAHRLSTVRECDHIFFIRKGRVVEEGAYIDLVQLNGSFSQMASIR